MPQPAHPVVEGRRDQMFPVLDRAEIERLARFGDRMAYAAGDRIVPIFVWEERAGARGHRFAALTFRTTAYNSGSRGTDVTGVGCFLAYSRMDRLPQLINVLRGEMTCVSACAELPFFLD